MPKKKKKKKSWESRAAASGVVYLFQSQSQSQSRWDLVGDKRGRIYKTFDHEPLALLEVSRGQQAKH